METDPRLPSYLLQLAGNAGVTSLLLLAAAWMCRNWVRLRLEAGIRHEYDRKLELLKDELQKSSQRELESLKLQLDHLRTAHAQILSGISQSHQASLERRIDAIAAAWQTIQDLRSATPFPLSFTEMFPSKVVPLLLKLPIASGKAQQSLAIEGIKELSDSMKKLNSIRPFLGEELFSLGSAHSAALLAACTWAETCIKEKELQRLHEQPFLRDLFGSTASPSELEQFDRQPAGKLEFVRGVLERKFLSCTTRLISGAETGDFSIEQSKRITDEIQKITREAQQPQLTKLELEMVEPG